jgi:hypothetical protein
VSSGFFCDVARSRLVVALGDGSLVALGFAIRIRTLSEELQGYGDYARHARWYLFPGIW